MLFCITGCYTAVERGLAIRVSSRDKKDAHPYPFFLSYNMSFFVNLVQDLFEGDEEEQQREEELSQTFHRHGSFAPVRHDAKVKFFIDGHDYFW